MLFNLKRSWISNFFCLNLNSLFIDRTFLCDHNFLFDVSLFLLLYILVVVVGCNLFYMFVFDCRCYCCGITYKLNGVYKGDNNETNTFLANLMQY